jgi:hypothetical protein
MKRFRTTAVLLAASLAMAAALCSCTDGRRIIQGPLADPGGKWVAVVDEVEYANGLLTSVADRVVVADSASSAEKGKGTIVFSEDALGDQDKPTVEWSAHRLVITISRKAAVLRKDPRGGGVQVEIRRR